MSPHRKLIRGGTLLTMDAKLGELARGDVLIEGEQISAVDAAIHADDCEVIDARGMIVLPGFVDAHRHTWQTQLRNLAADWSLFDYTALMRFLYSAFYDAGDAYLGNHAGALEALDAGITTLVDHCHILNTPEHADEALHGLEDSGIRAVFCYGMFGNPRYQLGRLVDAGGLQSPAWHFEDARRIRVKLSADSGRVRMGLALNELEAFPVDAARPEIELARELDALRVSCHVGMGALSHGKHFVERLAEARLLDASLLLVHGSALTDGELARIADAGASIAATPETEMQMGMGIPVTGRALAASVSTGLGIDIVSDYSGDMFAQMRLALQMERAWRNRALEERGLAPRTVTPTVREALALATQGGADAAGLGAEVGSLTPGKQADVVLISTRSPALQPVNDAVAAVVLSASAADVDSVFVAGRARKRAGRLLDVDMDSLFSRLAESRARIVAAAAEVDPAAARVLIEPFFPLL